MNLNSFRFHTVREGTQRTFVRRVIRFVAPMLLLGSPAIAILTWSHESFSDIEHHIARMDNQKMLIGYGYNQFNYGYLKHRRLSRLPPQAVVALGSSRVLPFRQQMFETSFYNAGFTISPLAEFQLFLERTSPQCYPEVLLIGLDQWMFNSTWVARTPAAASRWTTNSSNDVLTGLKAIPDLYKDLVRGRLSTSQTESDEVCVGLDAICNHTGFRNDGSFDYGSHVADLLAAEPVARPFRLAANRRLVGADEVDVAAVEELQSLLGFCKDSGISVVAFLPPFMDHVYEHMRESGEHGYLDRIPQIVRPLFDEYGFEFYEFQSMKACASDDSEAIDELHGGEVAYLKILVQMLDSGSVLNRHCSREKLEADLRLCPDRYTAYRD